MELKPGTRLRSAVCTTEVIVVRPPTGEVSLSCGGAAMLELGTEPENGGAIDPAQSGGTLLGKRYADEALGLEILCTKAGDGSLAINGEPLGLKDAKPLPSSD
jgi:hypothetical protein